MRANRKRLSVDLPTELFETVKKSAQRRNITITRWILRACYRKIAEERIEEAES